MAAGSPPAVGLLRSTTLCLSSDVQTMKMRRSGAHGPLAASPVAVATRRGPGPVATPAQQQNRGPATCRAALVSPQSYQCLGTVWPRRGLVPHCCGLGVACASRTGYA